MSTMVLNGYNTFFLKIILSYHLSLGNNLSDIRIVIIIKIKKKPILEIYV